jgi:hypothetical protein
MADAAAPPITPANILTAMVRDGVAALPSLGSRPLLIGSSIPQ